MPISELLPPRVPVMRRDLMELAGSWRHVLAEDPTNARPIVTSLLEGRVTIAPAIPRRAGIAPKKEWDLSGNGTLDGLFSRAIFVGMASPRGPGRFYTLKGSSRGAA
jgi:hypothetical protein